MEIGQELSNRNDVNGPFEIRVPFRQSRPKQCRFIQSAICKLGRTYFVVPYLKPQEPIRAEHVDNLRDALLAAYRHDLGSARAKIIVTGQPPHEPEQVPAEDPDAEANVAEGSTSEDSEL
jgi:hypothetical protein